jgi:hypothetical protein
LGKSLFEQTENRSYSPDLERGLSFMDHAADVFDVFWASGQDLRDDQVFRADDGNQRSGDIHRESPLEELLFEPGS